MTLWHDLHALVADARAHGMTSVDCAALERLLLTKRRTLDLEQAVHERRDLNGGAA